jgi:hypothetical protein
MVLRIRMCDDLAECKRLLVGKGLVPEAQSANPFAEIGYSTKASEATILPMPNELDKWKLDRKNDVAVMQ